MTTNDSNDSVAIVVRVTRAADVQRGARTAIELASNYSGVCIQQGNRKLRVTTGTTPDNVESWLAAGVYFQDLEAAKENDFTGPPPRRAIDTTHRSGYVEQVYGPGKRFMKEGDRIEY